MNSAKKKRKRWKLISKAVPPRPHGISSLLYSNWRRWSHQYQTYVISNIFVCQIDSALQVLAQWLFECCHSGIRSTWSFATLLCHSSWLLSRAHSHYRLNNVRFFLLVLSRLAARFFLLFSPSEDRKNQWPRLIFTWKANHLNCLKQKEIHWFNVQLTFLYDWIPNHYSAPDILSPFKDQSRFICIILNWLIIGVANSLPEHEPCERRSRRRVSLNGQPTF